MLEVMYFLHFCFTNICFLPSFAFNLHHPVLFRVDLESTTSCRLVSCVCCIFYVSWVCESRALSSAQLQSSSLAVRPHTSSLVWSAVAVINSQSMSTRKSAAKHPFNACIIDEMRRVPSKRLFQDCTQHRYLICASSSYF